MNGPAARRRAVVVALTLCVVLLPTLVAGASIAQPARVGELDRLAAAVLSRDAMESGPDLLWLGMFAGDSAEPAALQERLAVARFAALLGIFALSGLLWVTVAIARGRMQAAFTCLAFAACPAVWGDGAVLRPEIAATVFANLGLLLLVNLPERMVAGRREHALRAWTSILLLSLAIGTSIGLAVASGPAYGGWLFVPALATFLVVVREGRTLLAAIRRFRALVLPFRAVALRLLPWVVASFAALVATLLLLPESRKLLPTLGDLPLLGSSAWTGIPLLALAVLGGGRLFLRVAVDTGRRRRIDARALLAVYVTVLTVQHLARGDVLDALPATGALAILVAEGVFLLAWQGAARLGGITARPAT